MPASRHRVPPRHDACAARSLSIHGYTLLAGQAAGLCLRAAKPGTSDIFRGFMVSLYVKGKENGHVQAYSPNGAMGLK